MSDIIERAEAALQGAKRLELCGTDAFYPHGLITDLIAELKAARAVAFPPTCDCGGRLCLLPAADERHGSNNGYSNHGCRCTPCRNDHAAEKRRKNGNA